MSKAACRKKTDDKKPCSITMPLSLQRDVIEASKREDRSFSATVRVAVEAYLNKPA